MDHIHTHADNVVDFRLPRPHVQTLHDGDELAAGDGPAPVAVEQVKGLLELKDLLRGQAIDLLVCKLGERHLLLTLV